MSTVSSTGVTSVTNTIDTISISQSATQHIRFTIENGQWTCYKDQSQYGPDYDRRMIASLPCKAEDVIAALLCNMCKDDVEIFISRQGGVPVPVQRWYLIGMKTEAPTNSLNDGAKLKIE